MEAAREMVIQNMKKSQNKEKEWYDLKARDMKLRIGDQVLVLLPTSTNKLLSQWHGPYEVTRVIGKVNYEIEMPERRRKKVIFHINMLKKWQTPEKDQSLMEETLLVVESKDSVNEENIAEWRNENISSELKMGNQLERKQREELHELLRIFPEITSNKPGKTELTHHSISIVKEEKPIRQRLYRIPRAYQRQVEK